MTKKAIRVISFLLITCICFLMGITHTHYETAYADIGFGRLIGDDVNLRSSPESGDNIIGVLKIDEAVTLLSMDGDWYKIERNNGQVGWAWKTYITRISDPAATPTPTATSTPLTTPATTPNTTTAPVSTDKPVATATSTVMPTATAKPQTTPDATSTALPSADNVMVTLTTKLSDCIYESMVISGDSVNIRDGAGLSYDVIATANKGDGIFVMDISDEWYLAIHNGKFGWINREHTSKPAGVKYLVKADGGLNLRAAASTSADSLGLIDDGSYLLSFESITGWARVKTFDGKEGWVSADYVIKSTENILHNNKIPFLIYAERTVSLSNDYYTQLMQLDSAEAAKRNSIIEAAVGFLNTPYVYGGASSGGFDCSGYTYYLYNNIGGVSLKRSAEEQSEGGEHVTVSRLVPGDLIFFDTDGKNSSVTHVGMYVGEDIFIHSSSAKGKVVFRDIFDETYSTYYLMSKSYIK